jgi:hypothetical protein
MARYTVSILETCIYHIEVEAPKGDLRAAAGEARKQFLDMDCEEQLTHLQGIEKRNFDVLAGDESQAFDECEFSCEDDGS